MAVDGSYLVYAETGMYSLTRLWLTGANAGESEPFGGWLPGFPDNISTGSDGLIWVTLASPRNPLLDRVSPMPGLLRKINWALPERLQPEPLKATWVIALDSTGRIVHDLHDRGRNYDMVTGVREHNGTVYLGSLTGNAVAVTSIP
jgi:sugar lactone lactonase YvrE